MGRIRQECLDATYSDRPARGDVLLREEPDEEEEDEEEDNRKDDERDEEDDDQNGGYSVLPHSCGRRG